jgi:hypothetical protein
MPKAGDICSDTAKLLKAGQETPNTENSSVGEFRQRIDSSALPLFDFPDDIAFDEVVPKRMTPLLKHRLLALADLLEKNFPDSQGSPRPKLKVKTSWENADNRHGEGRALDLVTDPPLQGDNLEVSLGRLACLCRQPGVNFEYVRFWEKTGKPVHIHVVVPREDYLFRLKTKLPEVAIPANASYNKAKSILENGWMDFLRDKRFFDPSLQHPRITVDGPDVALRPVQITPENFTDGVTIGDIVLQTAARRGLTPKAFFDDPATDRISGFASIRLLPSPVSDLVTHQTAPDLNTLELSLRRVSYDGKQFVATREECQSVIERLIGNGGPYQGIEILVNEILRPQLVTLDEAPESSLTRILDQVALDVHGQWYWTGPNRIDFIPRIRW